MGQYDNLRSEIGKLDKEDALKKLEEYIQYLDKVTPSSRIPELKKLKIQLSKDVERYAEIHNSQAHKKMVEAHAAKGNENYNWGEEVSRLLNNYEAALDTVISVLPNEYKHLEKTKPSKSIVDFTLYFPPQYREVLPDLCKSLFNANNSQKDYAIMICLISQKYLLSFMRSDLYKSWYNFIDRPFSPKESFAGINIHFIDTEPYLFNESDKRYKSLKIAFEKVLKDKNIK